MSPALDLSSSLAATNGVHTNGVSSLKASKTPLDGFSTRAIHVGSSPDPSTGAVIPAISLSTTYAQSAPGEHLGYEYSRSDNPNRRALETLLASIEDGGKDAMAFGSGSAATGVVIQALGGPRKTADGWEVPHVLSVNDVYGGTYRYLKRVASEGQGLDVTLLDIENATEEDIRAAVQPNTKPLLLVDNTFASPFYQSPIQLGADLVLHSLTKYVNGHSDVVMGAVIVPSPEAHPASENDVGAYSLERQAKAVKFYEKLRFLQNATGAIPSPYDCWLAQRGAKTLALRMKAHGVNALKVAKALDAHPLVQSVIYPGLESNKGYDLAWANLSRHARKWILEDVVRSPLSSGTSTPSTNGDLAPPSGGFPFSGMISFRLPTFEHAVAFLQKSRLFTLAESLGGVESLAEHPASMTHGGIPAAERAAIGIDDGLVRLSVGIEEGEDLVKDVVRALDEVSTLEL
ncbi:hypothetical protein NMY22_g19462 [Coprinellus aureogranulatus]|nr:hypothetical protein NMY22_g19462 [Coprinellus aureogranulatus]